MNSCEPYQELISRLVDGEISHDEHEALMAHMNSCSRCNAMYAVFHDLSDILSDEAAPLPEGLHENIMADVRRSAMIKKNRRMRAFGLRTAVTAAACAVLVLFASTGFGPGKRAESVSVRSETPAAPAVSTPAPAAKAAEDVQASVEYETPVPTPAPAVRTAAPAATPVPVQVYEPVRTPAPVSVYEPVQTPAPVYPDAYSTAEDSGGTPYTAMQPQQYDDWFTAQIQTVAPTPDQSAIEAPFVWEAAPISSPAAVEAPEPPLSPVESAENLRDVSAAPEETALESSGGASAIIEERTAGGASAAETADRGGELPLFSLFNSSTARQRTALPAEPQGAEARKAEEAETSDVALETEEETPMLLFSALPAEEPEEGDAEEPVSTPAPVQTESLSVYGREARSRLLAMIGDREEALPAEGELTRLVHVSFIPEDSYGSEEKMDINIYGDFIFCRYYPVEGGVVTYRADCSLTNLDSFLESCRTGQAAVTPAPAPTADPYTAETPAADTAAGEQTAQSAR